MTTLKDDRSLFAKLKSALDGALDGALNGSNGSTVSDGTKLAFSLILQNIRLSAQRATAEEGDGMPEGEILGRMGQALRFNLDVLDVAELARSGTAGLLEMHKRILVLACVGQGASALGNRVLAARACLAQVQTEDADAERELERELAERLAVFLPTLTELAEDDPPQKDGIFAWDAELAAYLDDIGSTGKELAAKIRRKATERWEARRPGFEGFEGLSHLWVSEEGYAFRALAHLTRAIWCDVVAPRLERARKNPAALAMVIHKTTAALFSRMTREEERDGQRVLSLPGETLVRVVPMVDSAVSAALIDRGLKLFGTVAAHKLLRWQVFTAHKQALSGHPDPRVLTIEGGITGLTELIGLRSKGSAEQVRAIIEAEHSVELPVPGGTYGRLLNRALYPGRGQRRSRLELVLGTLLLPNYVFELKRFAQVAGHDMRLVPMLPIPPFAGGQERSYGPQATFSMLLVEQLRQRARELVTYGGVKFTHDEFLALADRAKLARVTLPAVLDRWTTDGDDGPAFLRRDGDRYTLGDAHKLERTFIEDGGALERDAQVAGQKSVAKKRAAIRRRGSSPRRK